MSEDVDTFGGFLRCETCGRQRPFGGAAWWLRHGGWPECHGYTMRWWTQCQIDAGEVPPVQAATLHDAAEAVGEAAAQIARENGADDLAASLAFVDAMWTVAPMPWRVRARVLRERRDQEGSA